MSEQRTVDTIMLSLNQIVAEKQSLSPHYWVEAAMFLNVLISEEHEKLWDLKQKVAEAKLEARKAVKYMTDAEAIVETTEVYKAMRMQEAKIEQVQELIRLGKLQARLTNDEIRSH